MKNLFEVEDSLGVKTAVDELNAAADLIEQRGACAIVYERGDGAHCPLGALWQASDKDVPVGMSWYSLVNHSDGIAQKALLKMLNLDEGHGIVGWNDGLPAAIRTKVVVNTLRECAARLANGEIEITLDTATKKA